MPEMKQPSPNNQLNQEYTRVSFFEAIKISKWGFSLLYKSAPVYTILYLVARVVQRFDDVVYALIFTRSLDILLKTIQKSGNTIEDLYPYLGVLFGYSVYSATVNVISNRSHRHIRTASRLFLKRHLYTKIKSLGIQTVEQPEVNNKIHRADDALINLIPYVFDSIELVSDLIKVVGLVILLFPLVPVVTVLAVIITIPHFMVDRVYRKKAYKLYYENTEKLRMTGSAGADLTHPRDLQEIVSTRAFNFLDRKYTDFRIWYNTISLKIKDTNDYLIHSVNFLKKFVDTYGYTKIFSKFLLGALTIGKVSFWMTIINNLDSTLSRTAYDFNDLSENAINIKDVYSLFLMESTYREGSIIIPQLSKGPNIEFKDVSFAYPGTEKVVINNINLKVRSGEKIAIVGRNGAGKTTLIKLISRFYPVTKGKLLFEDIDMNDIYSESLYNNLSTLYQDFNTYSYLTAKENICIGRSEEEPNEVSMRTAAQTADAMDFISEFPNKFEQILNETYKGGIRPSTGQWQKIAIARFFYRNSPLVIFDEPTASIDAISEYNIFSKIYDFFEGKTVIIISHRFSTVRNADRIIVLDKGEIVEEGSHEELMKLNGKYAEGFRLQAEGYTE
ncbi:MAG: ABC transporter ATP-binding protein [Patescibacteria group bacterium]